MSQNNDTYNPFDPTGMMRDMRDASMDAWAKMMVEIVNSDAYAEATGTMLDAWLSSSGPLRKAMENAMSHTLKNLKLPSSDDVVNLAERLTNIEMRLDDIEAKLDESLHAPKKSKSSKKNKANSEEN